jgi:cytidine deaminase
LVSYDEENYMEEETVQKLISNAYTARLNSYSPYSKYPVGAALLCADGSIYTGCNVENAAYSPGNCAERTAVFKAVSEGKREFTAIAIVGGNSLTSPCGVCRQVLREFVNPEEFKVIMTAYDEKAAECLCQVKDKTQAAGIEKSDYKIMTLSELLPVSFGPDNLA